MAGYVGRDAVIVGAVRTPIGKGKASGALHDMLSVDLLGHSLKELVARMGVDPAQIDEAAFDAELYTAGIPEPDLLIRTSGEQRISNFMLWQLAYTEMYITPTLWPDFTRRDLFEAILEYQQRERRFGRVTAS